ncbi:MAG: formylglycine-generating enzyme family protein [Opitutaceae bacterium]|nr:formylglycine-generating enzyme family protein [Opitutaceae bacterium]
MKLVWIAPGTFTMGTPDDEAAHLKNESPQTRVTITQGYWLGSHEVTQRQWKALMGTDVVGQARVAQMDDTFFLLGGKNLTHLRDYFNVTKDDDTMRLVGNTDDNLPIIWVSWNEAMVYCRKLTEAARQRGDLPTGYEYRLPTEAEWEYACRAGTTGGTHVGDQMVIEKDGSSRSLDPIAWYAANIEVGYEGHCIDTDTWATKKPEGAGQAGPRAVGTKSPNAWGLFDMLGNAAEWCMDWDGAYPGGSVSDWQGPATGKFKVRRGGGWSTFASHARSGYRNWHEPEFRWINLGFRVALAPVH